MKPHDWSHVKIKPGQTLTARSSCDYDCIFEVKVLERKGMWAVVQERNDPPKRKKIQLDYNGGECVYAFGKYSMAPCFRPPTGDTQQPSMETL